MKNARALLCVAFVVCIVCVVFLMKRKKQRKNKRDRTPFQLDDIPRGSVDTSGSSVNPVYQNVADIRQHHQGMFSFDTQHKGIVSCIIILRELLF